MNRSLFRVAAVVIGLLFVAVGVGAAMSLSGPAVAESRALQLGVYDDSEVFGHPTRAFQQLKQIHTQVLRANLRWGGLPLAVAKRRPENPGDPADPAYNWSPFDEMVKRAADADVKVLATIVGTPAWANGGKARYYPPKNMSDLRAFAAAAAKRYSGDYVPGGAEDPLPAIRLWLAWNEPNNPVFLRPQWKKRGNRYVVNSPVLYAKMCNAIYAGVHSTRISGEKVACGATAPRGNNRARGTRPSISPLVFLNHLKRNRARFDVYAHHPYYSGPAESPTTPPNASTAITLGNIGILLRLLQKLYPGKHLWITEYGYQTNPPDRIFGVSYAKQARWMSQAVAKVRKTPKIDMLVWFLLRDDRRIANGWQSGLVTARGKKKPAYATFSRLARLH